MEHYLVFRVHSVIDKDGKIVSADYGKIYPPIEYGFIAKHHGIRFTYYFNPDGTRNLEFNTKLNLFTNLSSLEQVYTP